MCKWKGSVIGLAIAAAAAPTIANAAPAYLQCEMPNGPGQTLRINVQLNEEGGIANYSFPHSGDSYRVGAIFTPNAVSFGAFSIDRATLAIQRRNDGRLARLSNLPAVSVGQCQLDQRERAF